MNDFLGSGSISTPGIGSGLDIASIIQKLMDVQNKPIVMMQAQEAKMQTTLSAFGSLKGALSQFQTSLQGLNTIASYQTISASIANTAVANATATSSATPGTYSLQVNQLAKAQSLIAAGQASATNAIGAGTISFSFGTTTGTVADGKYGAGTTFTGNGAAPKTVTIDPSDSSLTGIAAAINAADIGVTASVINDGTDTPYRLSLTSTATGEASSMQISVQGDAALANLLSQDPTSTTGQQLTQTSTAQNAKFTLNGLAITSTTNSNSTAIPGVTLNLLTTNADTPTTLSITQSSSGASTAINSFVSAYNTIRSVIEEATAFNEAAQKGGPLQGQNSVLSIINGMQQIINSPVPGAPSNLSMLGQVGIGFNNDGTMTVDSTKLEAALKNNPTGVAGLFASVGTSTDSLIQFNGSSSASKPGAYAINVTQIATQGKTVGSASANTTITAGINDTLQVELNGVTATVVLAAGTYSNDGLANAVQAAINTNSAFNSGENSVSVTQTAGVLTIHSNTYGSESKVTITGGNGMLGLLGSGATNTTGVDVAGTIGGQPATGTGQVLKSSAGNSAGLSIVVDGGNLGARGTINFTEGYVNELNNYMTTVLGDAGQIASATDGINASVKDIQNSVEARTELNKLVLSNYQREFTELDVMLSKLSNTSSFLTQQLAALSAQLTNKS